MNIKSLMCEIGDNFCKGTRDHCRMRQQTLSQVFSIILHCKDEQT